MPPKSVTTTKRPLSSHQALQWTTYAIATAFIAFGLNALLNPPSALSFFGLPYPADPSTLSKITLSSYSPDRLSAMADTKVLVDSLLAVYGVRDVFMGLAIALPTYLNERRVAGAMVVTAGFVAIWDGWVTYRVGKGGQWGHWGYAPLCYAVGGGSMGLYDRWISL